MPDIYHTNETRTKIEDIVLRSPPDAQSFPSLSPERHAPNNLGPSRWMDCRVSRKKEGVLLERELYYWKAFFNVSH